MKTQITIQLTDDRWLVNNKQLNDCSDWERDFMNQFFKDFKQENFYIILSLKHTRKDESQITLWRANNQGYTTCLEYAGKYQKYEDGYHNSENNLPISNDLLKKLDIGKRADEYGDEVTVILNTKHNHNVLGIQYKNETLLRKHDL